MLQGRETMTDHARHYSDEAFAAKLTRISGLDGLFQSSNRLYRILKSPDTPRWVKAMCLTALGYLVLPTDAVADIVPVAGFVDDAAMITAALAAITARWDSADVENRAE